MFLQSEIVSRISSSSANLVFWDPTRDVSGELPSRGSKKKKETLLGHELGHAYQYDTDRSGYNQKTLGYLECIWNGISTRLSKTLNGSDSKYKLGTGTNAWNADKARKAVTKIEDDNLLNNEKPIALILGGGYDLIYPLKDTCV